MYVQQITVSITVIKSRLPDVSAENRTLIGQQPIFDNQ